jgi:hypothetical protein
MQKESERGATRGKRQTGKNDGGRAKERIK